MISVIVPAYNAEKYLNRCVDSILGQTYRMFELILVDDGSTDKTGEICDEYAFIDRRVRVIHIQNLGVSAARNKALDIAVGEYIFFVDADDYIKVDTFQKMREMITKTKVEIVYCPHEKERVAFPRSLLENEEIAKAMFDYRLGWAVWHCLYARKVWENIRFNETCVYGEDACAWIELLINEVKVLYYPEKFYYYNDESEGSGTRHNKNEKHMRGEVIYLKKVFEYGKSNQKIREYANYFICSEWLNCVDECAESPFITREELDNACHEMHPFFVDSFQEICQTPKYSGLSFKSKLKWNLYRFFPSLVLKLEKWI